MSDELFDILDRLELPGGGAGEMPRPVAEYVLGIHFSEAEQDRYQALASRHNNGELSPAELKILEGFVDADSLLSIVHAVARKSLTQHQPAA